AFADASLPLRPRRLKNFDAVNYTERRPAIQATNAPKKEKAEKNADFRPAFLKNRAGFARPARRAALLSLRRPETPSGPCRRREIGYNRSDGRPKRRRKSVKIGEAPPF
ncbi:MAG: hypothetical protein IJ991_01580, partial [Thermoguttaceae bacterium]|nr:hypothetical protein [Thermoguttaceae bacterium]